MQTRRFLLYREMQKVIEDKIIVIIIIEQKINSTQKEDTCWEFARVCHSLLCTLTHVPNHCVNTFAERWA